MNAATAVNWVLVADSARARLFEQLPGEKQLREIADFPNPDGRAQERELTSDAQGRVFDRGRDGQSHGAGPEVSAVDHAVDVFARDLAERLEKARKGHRYDRLALIAAPRFLGKLRGSMGKDLRATVGEEIDKDLSQADARTIAGHLSSLKAIH